MPSPPPGPTQSNLNIIALISGGKDSLYTLLHCLRNGHRIVALANLYPAEKAPEGQDQKGSGNDDDDNDDDGTDEEDDIDSFMYQTIGHSVIPQYEAALGIPLYRGRIVGGAVDAGRVYGGPPPPPTSRPCDDGAEGDGDDETESLLPLLQRIKRAHPEANAVSAGAILSTYQRTRIEHVAARLDLVPLAWLWMYPTLPEPVERRGVGAAGDAGLLEDMAAVGCEARIIKVASGGLDEGFLWGDVSGREAGLRRRLVKGMRPFTGDGDVKGAVLGEGGEYETLALDGPGFLWKRRIEIVETRVRRAEGGVGYLRLKGARCASKEGSGQDCRVEDVRRPGLLDEVFEDALKELVASSAECDDTVSITDPAARLDLNEPRLENHDAVQVKNGGLWTISNMTAPEAGPGAGEQMEAIASKTKAMLESSDNRSTDDIVFATILLHSMADFSTVNAVYASLFKRPNPPARATVACGNRLPDGVQVMVSFAVDLNPKDLRQGLHVQSLSYWAPANIGPYSQAMSIPLRETGRLVYVAGQIPLEPASMKIVSRSPTEKWLENFSLRAVLSLQHLWRIGTAMEVDWWLGAVAFLAGEDCDTKARVAWRLWQKLHMRKDEDSEEDEPQLDAWDIKYGRRRADEQQSKYAGSFKLPNFAVVQSEASTPPFFAAQVESLPRESDIEWQGLGCRCEKGTMTAGEIDSGRRTDTIVDGDVTYTGIEIDMAQSELVSQCLQHVVDTYCQHPAVSHAAVYTASPLPGRFWPGQIVPCKAVWGREGQRLAAGIILQGTKTR